MKRYQVEDMLKCVIIQARLGDQEAKAIVQEIESLHQEHVETEKAQTQVEVESEGRGYYGN